MIDAPNDMSNDLKIDCKKRLMVGRKTIEEKNVLPQPITCSTHIYFGGQSESSQQAEQKPLGLPQQSVDLHWLPGPTVHACPGVGSVTAVDQKNGSNSFANNNSRTSIILFLKMFSTLYT